MHRSARAFRRFLNLCLRFIWLPSKPAAWILLLHMSSSRFQLLLFNLLVGNLDLITPESVEPGPGSMAEEFVHISATTATGRISNLLIVSSSLELPHGDDPDCLLTRLDHACLMITGYYGFQPPMAHSLDRTRHNLDFQCLLLDSSSIWLHYVLVCLSHLVLDPLHREQLRISKGTTDLETLYLSRLECSPAALYASPPSWVFALVRLCIHDPGIIALEGI